MKSAAQILLGQSKLGPSFRERFCPECGTLLTHDGFVWKCRNCTEKVGVELRLMR